MLIRASRESDLSAIQAIYAHAVETGSASFELQPPDTAEMAHRRSGLVNGGYPYFVAEIDQAIAGFAYAGPYRTRPAYRFTVESSVYVNPEFHRRGVGSALLQTILAEAETKGFRQIVAVIGDSGNTGSIEVHRRAGFDLVGVFRDVGWKHGRWLDTVLMQKSLGEGSVTTPPGDG